MHRESRKSDRTKKQSKATKKGKPGDRLARIERRQARVPPRGTKSLRPSAHLRHLGPTPRSRPGGGRNSRDREP